jgi:hypothetical protein
MKRYRRAAALRNFFRIFMAMIKPQTAPCLPAAAQKSKCGPMRYKSKNRMPPFCRGFVATISQDAQMREDHL